MDKSQSVQYQRQQTSDEHAGRRRCDTVSEICLETLTAHCLHQIVHAVVPVGFRCLEVELDIVSWLCCVWKHKLTLSSWISSRACRNAATFISMTSISSFFCASALSFILSKCFSSRSSKDIMSSARRLKNCKRIELALNKLKCCLTSRVQPTTLANVSEFSYTQSETAEYASFAVDQTAEPASSVKSRYLHGALVQISTY